MAVDPINAALEEGHRKLTELLTERAKIDKEIVGWKRLIDSLLAVSESDATDPSDISYTGFIANELGLKTMKFTDGIRLVLRQNASRDIPISVPEIREQLINLGFDFAKYKQPLVPIHNALKRLEDQGEVSPLKNEQGQTLGYKWISPVKRALDNDWNAVLEGRNMMAHRAGVALAVEIEKERNITEAICKVDAVTKGNAAAAKRKQAWDKVDALLTDIKKRRREED